MINERRSLRKININLFFKKKMLYLFVLKKNFWTSFLLRQQLHARPSSLQRRLLYFQNNHFSTRFYFLKSRGFLDKTLLTSIIINLSHNIGKGFSLCVVWKISFFNLFYYSIILEKWLFQFSKMHLVVYYQCCVLIGWATTRLYVIAY